MKAKSKQSSVTYVNLHGTPCSILSSESKYKLVKATGQFSSATLNCGEKYKCDDKGLIEYAKKLILTEPPFIERRSIFWILAYIDHFAELLGNVLNGSEPPQNIPEIFKNTIKQNRNPIYIARLCTAVHTLNKIVNGGWDHSSDSYVMIDGLVDDRRLGSEANLAKNIKLCSNYLGSGPFRGAMTRSYFKGNMLKFTPPPGEIFIIKTKAKEFLIKPGIELLLRLDGFPYESFSRNYSDDAVNFGAPKSDDETGFEFALPVFEGRAYNPDQKLEGWFYNELDFMRYYVPLDWVTAICDYGDDGLVDVKVPNHQYCETDQSCLNVAIHLPSLNGRYSDDMRITAKCFAFAKDGISLPYPEKSISPKDLALFVKSQKVTTKTLKIREAIDRVVNSSCIYYVPDVQSWNSINRLNPAERVFIFKSCDALNCEQIAITTNRKSGGDILIIGSDLASYISETDSTAKTFKHATEKFDVLLSLIRFDYSSIGQKHIIEVLKLELFGSPDYKAYANSDERTKEVLESVHEGMSEWMRDYL